jgi:UDP-N-acetylmuramoyl-L-alanyl-D-glutamate--2,6-diaminopimelate ligase
MSVSLGWLLDGIAEVPAGDARVVDLTLDSREARAGSLFFALGGRQAHGVEFAADAAARGASVVLWEPDAEGAAPDLPASVLAAAVPGLKGLIGRIADRFFGWPSAHLRIVGITGTNGKTTTAYLLTQCLDRLGRRAAYIGTIGWGRIGALSAPTHTTPDVINLHRRLAQLRGAGVHDVALEVSSHALDQGRTDGVRLQCAALTNLSRDHLDYHGSMQAYGEAKARLFTVPGLQQIVINIGDPFGRDLAARAGSAVPVTAVWVGAGDSGWLADRSLHADDLQPQLHGMAMSIDGSFGKQRVATRLLGRFNAENSVLVLGCLASLGVPLADAAQALAECTAPPGRMEVVDTGIPGKPMAVVDYAHTPDALAKALAALREHCQGVLWCVFGCGGDRDAGKRPMMGAIAEELADQIIVTDDNPRSENPQAITDAIIAGFETRPSAARGAARVRIIHDRGAAIETALCEARSNDVVLIAGKGHEEYQIYGDTRCRFSDRREALRCLGVAA